MDQIDIKQKTSKCCEYMKNNKQEVAIYVALFIGLLFLFINPLVGEFILGLLTGYYFFQELVFFIQNARFMLLEKGRVRYVILMGLLLALLLFAPVFFISTILITAIRLLFTKTGTFGNDRE